MRRLLVLLILAQCWAAPALAVQPDEILKDPQLESRARAISAGLRCLVCQNQSIDDSDASVARDLRILIREQLLANKSDAEVIDFVVARYGEFVLLKPRFSGKNLVLWLAPFAILALALAFGLRRRQALPPSPVLSPEESAEIAAILRRGQPNSANPPQT
jgi:cytochrome c-type biogenesis protein CcmH